MTVIFLDHSLDPLISQFNTLHDTPRLLAPLSPTCPECRYGAQVVSQVIDATPSLQALVIWIPMLPGDNPTTTLQAAATYDHPRIAMFADPERLAGRHIAARLGGDGWIAWDCYLLYPSGVVWEDDLPLPSHWYHQLDRQSVHPTHQRCGSALLPALLDSVQRL
jgi:hypothetical protein